MSTVRLDNISRRRKGRSMLSDTKHFRLIKTGHRGRFIYLSPGDLTTTFAAKNVQCKIITISLVTNAVKLQFEQLWKQFAFLNE